MNSITSRIFLCVGLIAFSATWSVEAASDRQPPPSPQGTVPSRQSEAVEYFVNLPMSAFTGRENLPWGELQICVKISDEHGQKYVSFWDVLTKKGSSWVTAPTALHKLHSGKLHFKSKDNWANEGIGQIEFLNGNQIRFEMQAAKQPDVDSSNIIPIYGTFVLPKAPCPYARFFEQLRP